MREFTIRSGKFAGKHIIYDSTDEATRAGIKEIKSPWYSDDVQIGDWCLSDDGYVAQCLHRFKLVNKRHKSGQYTDTFRFCNGSFYVYYDRNGRRHIKNFYAVVAANHKSSLGNTSKLGKYMPLKKKHFVALVAQGVDPYTAYLKSYRTSFFKGSTWIQVNKLLSDPLVRQALMEELKPFISKVEDSIKAKTGFETISDWLVDQLVNLVIDVKLSSKEKRANIQLILSLFGEQIGAVKQQSKSKREIQDADYEIMPPPKLGTNSL